MPGVEHFAGLGEPNIKSPYTTMVGRGELYIVCTLPSVITGLSHCGLFDSTGPVQSKIHVKLSYPDTATDEFGNAGFWTLIYNQVILLVKIYL